MGLEPRPHTITQTAVPSGMSVTSIVCRHESDASLAPFTVTGNSVVVTLAQGDHVRCTFVNSQDPTPPTITCPSDVTETNDVSACGAVVAFGEAIATDDMDPDVDVSCSPANNTFFAVATTPVTCTATDNAGNSAQCQFDVTVKDRKSVV